MTAQFSANITPPANPVRLALWFAFSGGNLLVYNHDTEQPIPELDDFGQLGLPILRQQFLGTLNNQPCYSIEIPPDIPAPDGLTFEPLREVFMRLNEGLISAAGRAFQVMDWDRNHQFCGRCGARTENSPVERVKTCPACGLMSYPRLSPSMIVAVTRGDTILLARNAGWPAGFYSVLAGFVEAGETVEETIEREVCEETGITVKNMRYFGSQPWPFPNSFMLGFTAEYAAGEIRIDENELADAQWFSVDNLPKLPPKISIARRLIDDFIARVQKR